MFLDCEEKDQTFTAEMESLSRDGRSDCVQYPSLDCKRMLHVVIHHPSWVRGKSLVNRLRNVLLCAIFSAQRICCWSQSYHDGRSEASKKVSRVFIFRHEREASAVAQASAALWLLVVMFTYLPSMFL